MTPVADLPGRAVCLARVADVSTPTLEREPVQVMRAAWIGVAVSAALLVFAFTVPHLFSWDVNSRESAPGRPAVPPLRGYLDGKLIGPGTVPAVLTALLGWLYLPRWAEQARWRTLLLVSFGVSLVWLLSLAYVDGSDGISRVQAFPFEYLTAARGITDVGETLGEFNSRITYGQDDSWPTHVSGHPPGAVLFFVGLVRLGIDTPYAVGLVMTVIAALGTTGVLVCLRTLGAEAVARRAVPFLVLTPAAVFMAVSADAVFATVCAWGAVLLALAATAERRSVVIAWAVASGVVFGYAVEMSYGLPLMGVIALGVLAVARSWSPLPYAVLGALAVVGVFALLGAPWWEGYPLLHDRYWEGLAGDRPQAYWAFGNLGSLLVSAGPALGVGIACTVARVRAVRAGRDEGGERTVVLLALAAGVAVLMADLSRMSKAEVERIWLPFIPWLLLSTVLLPPRWRRPALAVQVVVAITVQQLVWTEW